LEAKEMEEAEEAKEKTCTFAHARRRMRARRLGSGCDSEVCAVIRKQFTVADFREAVNSQFYGRPSDLNADRRKKWSKREKVLRRSRWCAAQMVSGGNYGTESYFGDGETVM
jgi:hypothetical protein